MACSTSECLASATLACTSPVLGSKTSLNRPEAPLTALPPIKWPISRMVVLLAYFRVRSRTIGHLTPVRGDFCSFLPVGHRLVVFSGPFFFHQWLAFTPS